MAEVEDEAVEIAVVYTHAKYIDNTHSEIAKNVTYNTIPANATIAPIPIWSTSNDVTREEEDYIRERCQRMRSGCCQLPEVQRGQGLTCDCLDFLVNKPSRESVHTVRRFIAMDKGLAVLRDTDQGQGYPEPWEVPNQNLLQIEADAFCGLYSHFELPVKPAPKGFCVEAKDLPSNLSFAMCSAAFGHMMYGQAGFQHLHNLYLKIPQANAGKCVAAHTRARVINNRVLTAVALLRHTAIRRDFLKGALTKTRGIRNVNTAAMVLPDGNSLLEFYQQFYDCELPPKTFDGYYLPVKTFLLSLPSNEFIFGTSKDCMDQPNTTDATAMGKLMRLKGTVAFVMQDGIQVNHRGDMWCFEIDEGACFHRSKIPIVDALKDTFRENFGSNGKSPVNVNDVVRQMSGCQTIVFAESDLALRNGLYVLISNEHTAVADEFMEQLLRNLCNKKIIEDHHSFVTIRAEYVKYPVTFLGKNHHPRDPADVTRLTMCTLPCLDNDPSQVAVLHQNTTIYNLIMPLDDNLLLRVWRSDPMAADAPKCSFVLVPRGFYILMPATMFCSYGINTSVEGNSLLKLQVTLSDQENFPHLNPVTTFYPPHGHVAPEATGDYSGIVISPTTHEEPAAARNSIDRRNDYLFNIDGDLQTIAKLFVH